MATDDGYAFNFDTELGSLPQQTAYASYSVPHYPDQGPLQVNVDDHTNNGQLQHDFNTTTTTTTTTTTKSSQSPRTHLRLNSHFSLQSLASLSIVGPQSFDDGEEITEIINADGSVKGNDAVAVDRNAADADAAMVAALAVAGTGDDAALAGGGGILGLMGLSLPGKGCELSAEQAHKWASLS
jgi:hypothetical protein